jgi:8-oxo-dGTP pyrophosphatase MutT (NUDIX family)
VRTDPRSQILEILDAALLFDDRDRAEAKRIIAFVHANPDCLERSNLAGHLTASAFVVDRERRHLLLIHHKALGRWLQPGGHADGDPNLLAVARREVREETGLDQLHPITTRPFDLDIHSIPERKGVPEHLHYDVRFLFEADGGSVLQGDEREVHGARWVPLSDHSDLNLDESVLRAVRRIGSLPHP